MEILLQEKLITDCSNTLIKSEFKKEPCGIKEEPCEVTEEPFRVKDEPREVKEEPSKVKEEETEEQKGSKRKREVKTARTRRGDAPKRCIKTRQKTSEEIEDSSEDSDADYVPDSDTDTDEEPLVIEAASKSVITKTSQGCSKTPIDGIEKFEVCFNTTSTTSSSESKPLTSLTTGGHNFCFVCQKSVSKLARHLKTHIKDDGEIAKALSLPVGSKTRKELLEKLRNKGNFMHNIKVQKNGSGSLKVKRKPKEGGKTYDYCMHCQAMFLDHELWRHMRRCSANPDEGEHQGRKRVPGIAALIKSGGPVIEEGVHKLLSRMHDDQISVIVRNDFCLLRYAESLYYKHGHDLSKHEHVQQKICQLARFLLTLRQISPIVYLEDALKPRNFLKVIEGVKKTAGFNKKTKSYKTPRLALKLGQSLLKVSDILRCHGLMAEDDGLIKSAEAFQKLYQARRSELISHCALTKCSDLKNDRQDDLPLTEDIHKLHKHLDNTTEQAATSLKKMATAQHYSSLAHATLTKIVLFNRRCIGEVSKMKLTDFLHRDRSPSYERMGLSDYEQKLCKYFDRVELEVKSGRKVAVLLTPDMSNALNLMTTMRKDCGVPDENEYLFAVPNCLMHYRGHQCLRRLSEECGAKKPDRLRSTQLHKQIATTSQILHLKNNELDHLADFLGHDVSVHRQFYRLSEPSIKSGNIYKLLLALEKGKLQELHGKSLDQITDLTDEEENSEEMTVETSLEEAAPELDVSTRRRHIPKRRTWRKAEVQAVMRHFKAHIQKGQLASVKDCETCKSSEHPALQNRTVQNIRDFVRNRGLRCKH